MPSTIPESATSADVETEFRVRLPAGLKTAIDALEHEADPCGEPLCWAAAQIVEENRELRTSASLRELYMPFDHLLFFSGAGDGDLFACAIDADGQIRREDIFRWRHETDAREWVAGNYIAYLNARREE